MCVQVGSAETADGPPTTNPSAAAATLPSEVRLHTHHTCTLVNVCKRFQISVFECMCLWHIQKFEGVVLCMWASLFACVQAVGAETTGVTPGPRTNAQPQVPSSKKDGVRRKRLQRMQSKGTVTAAKFRVKPNLQAESVIRKCKLAQKRKAALAKAREAI